MEFTALANHRKAIRAEITASAERYRAEQARGIASVFERYEIASDVPVPLACSVLLTAVSRFLVIEHETLGMSTGHDETVAYVEQLIRGLEGDRRPRPTA